MLLLALFAFIAGAGTALSPCVLPILPAVLGAGVSGGQRRPMGVVTGLFVSFTFAIVGLVYVIDALGLPNDFVRTLAIVVLFAFGLMLLVPPLADRVEALISRLVPAIGKRGGDGFWSGFTLGAGLGVIYAPCAGPILAGVITVSAAQEFTAARLTVALAYALGSAVVLYAVLIGGRKLLDRLAPYRARIQMALGAVMVATAVAMVADLDLRFQRAIAEDLPAFLRNPATSLEESEQVADELAAVRGGEGAAEGGAAEAELGEALPVLGRAPEFAGGNWFNTPDDEPLTQKGLTDEGEVVLIDFWTYTCINCIRTLPELRSWEEQYGEDGLTIVGVHAPEFPFEREEENVANAIDEYDIEYPVIQDNELATWDAYQNQYWPAKYLIDAEGNIRYTHFGEGDYETTERAIRSLLAEAGNPPGEQHAEADAETADAGLRTPETYLGAARAQGFLNGPILPGEQDFGGGSEPVDLPPNGYFYRGEWTIGTESAEAGEGAAIDQRFKARRVFLVMGSEDGPAGVRVLLDGEPISAENAGEDVTDSVTTVEGQRLYRLVDLPKAGDHMLTLEFEPGVEGYAFTYG